MKKKFQIGSHVFCIFYDQVHEGIVKEIYKVFETEKNAEKTTRKTREYITLSGSFYANNGAMRFLALEAHVNKKDVFWTKIEAKQNLDKQLFENFKQNLNKVHYASLRFNRIKKKDCTERQWEIVKEILNLKKKIIEYKRGEK